MKNYTLSLISGTNFTISLNGTALTTAEFATLLINDAGSAQFTPDADAAGFTIWDSSAMDGSSMTSSESITNGTAYEGTWSAAAAGATTNSFTTFTEAEGVAMTKYQISDLMGKIKEAGEGFSVPTYETSTNVLLPSVYTSVGTEKIFIVRNVGSANISVRCSTSNSGVVLAPSASVFVVVSTNAARADSTYPGGSRQGMAFIVYGQGGGNTGTGYFGPTVFYASGEAWIERQLPLTASHYPFNSSDQLTSISGPMSVISGTAGVLIGQLILGTYTGSYGGYSYPLMNAVRAWTTIGTGSKYTKRALQTTLNIAETGLTGLTANDWNTLFTLPANYYPNAQLVTGCTMLDNGVLVNGLVRVTTAGAVQVYAGANTTEVYGLLTMPVNS